MQKLIRLHDAVFATVSNILAPWFLPTAARFSFASVLLWFFWNSGKTKLGENIFTPSLGAYAQVFPRKMEALGYDVDMMSGLDTIIVLMGTYAEFILPALIVLGLFTRLASLGMVGFIVMMSIVDIYGHGLDAKTIGQMFDGDPYGLLVDQRLLWGFVLSVLVIKGAGPFSADHLLRRMRG
ncbi:MAG: DoxX family protein [Paracoccaceae bacterium]